MTRWRRKHPKPYGYGRTNTRDKQRRKHEEPAEDSSFERIRDFREDQMWRDSEREQDRA